jgi:hypothetical protein
MWQRGLFGALCLIGLLLMEFCLLELSLFVANAGVAIQ